MEQLNEIVKIRELCERGELSQGQIARETGINRGLLSLVLSGKYTGDIERYNNQLSQWYRKREARRSLCQTSCFKAVQQICGIAKDERKFAVITGDSGVGKTEAVHYFAQTQTEVAIIVCDKTMNINAMMIAIGRAVGENVQGMTTGSIYDRKEMIVNNLRREPKTIIIDEADLLNYRELEIIRAIYDVGFCSLILIGLARLETIMSKGRTLKENYAQIYSRVGIKRELKAPTKDDIKLILDQYGYQVGESFISQMKATIHEKGELRMLVNILENAKKFQELNSDEARIQAALRLVMGIE